MVGADLIAKTSYAHTLCAMFMPYTLLPASVPTMPYDTVHDLPAVARPQWAYNVLFATHARREQHGAVFALARQPSYR